MARQVWSTIVAEVLSTKYYSIIVDSTSDLTNLDQLAFAVRYVNKTGSSCWTVYGIHCNGGAWRRTSDKQCHQHPETVENFNSKLSRRKLRQRQQHGGKYSGVQARIENINPLAHFVPCSVHSLNIVSSCAAECCVNAISFFEFVQNLYNFFAVSTHRWKILTNSRMRSTQNIVDY